MNFINFFQLFLFVLSPSFSSNEVNYVEGVSVEATGNVIFETEDIVILSESINFSFDYSNISSESFTEISSGNLLFSLIGFDGKFNTVENSIERLVSNDFELKIKSEDPLSPDWIFKGEDFLYEGQKWIFSNVSFGNWEPLPDSGFFISAKKCILQKIESDLYELNFQDVDFYILSKKVFSLKSMKREFHSRDDFSNILTFVPVLQNHESEGLILGFRLTDFGAFGGLLSSSLTTTETGKTELFIDGKLPIGQNASFSLGLGSVFEVDKSGNGYWVSASPSYILSNFFENGNEIFNMTLNSGRFSVNDSALFNMSGGILSFKKEFGDLVFQSNFSDFSGNRKSYESFGANFRFRKSYKKSTFIFGIGKRDVKGFHPIPSRQDFSWEGPSLSSFVNFSEGWAFATKSEWDINNRDFVTNEISLIKSFNGIALNLGFETEEKLFSFSFDLLSF